jgi:hypothetical protein
VTAGAETTHVAKAAVKCTVRAVYECRGGEFGDAAGRRPLGHAALALGDEGAEVLGVRLGRRHELQGRQVVRDVRQVARAHARHQRAQRVAESLRLHERVRDALLPVVTHLVQPAAPPRPAAV